MKKPLVAKTFKNVICTVFLVVMLVSAQVGIAGAGLIDVAGDPANLNPWGLTVVTGGTQYAYGSVWVPSPPAFIDDNTWAFTPPSQSVDGAYVSQSSSVTYTGSSLTAQGSGAVSTTKRSNNSSSGFSLTFTPSVNATFHLSLSLLGDIFLEGLYDSGAVSFTAFPTGSPWYSLIVDTSGCQVNCGAIMSPVTFDLTKTLYAGVHYVFSIGAEASLQNTYYTAPESVTSASAEWNFNLSLSEPNPVPAPEPATMLLLGLGLVGLAGARRKFKK